ncbi:nitrate reductase molybdenum cofactor assembly chaperone [Streptomyces carminius]|uniref:Nitrate reductase molybdenum cofactor assembly chaperone n=1 Tax=Streptomyces carminius TaxID=2665496 RepID=A0A2M8LTM4_9ACTN|nr:nitrate reductase molybdenum cofactor assembly chaperone [Streptomyces carminius]PJE95313.1 nitrate reductase molybdenum cofactor assembly chaperone [Streptomyces carminius]
MTPHAPPRQPVQAPAWQIQSLLLAYPDDQLPEHARLARQAAAALPEPVAAPLRRFLDEAEAIGPEELAERYVAVFDHRRRCCPYLTYYTHGDTRKRGMALLRVKQAYAAAGLRPSDDELPDHLAVVLEFAAAEPEAGRKLLLEYRAGVELLRLALHDAGAPWAHVLESVSATLPPLAGDERTAVARLAAEGPPEEEVGLTPYAPSQYTPDTVGGRR